MAKSQNTYSFIKFEYGTLKNFYKELTANTDIAIGYQTLGTWMRGAKPHESNMPDYTAVMDYLIETKGVKFPNRKLNSTIVPMREIPFAEVKKGGRVQELLNGIITALTELKTLI